MTLKEILNFFDFDYDVYEDGYGLVDLQEANLGNIESERYNNPIDLVTRLVDGIYSDDYLFDEDIHDIDKEEYIKRYGEDKTFEGGYLYYALHPEELEELPPILNNII